MTRKAKTTPSSEPAVTARAVVFGFLLMPLMVYWLVQMEVVRYTHPTLVHPLSNVVFVLFCMIAANGALRRVRVRWAFSAGELMTVYVMLGVLSALCTHDLLEILMTILAYPYRFATPENEWRELILPHIPRWLTVWDPKAVGGFYDGKGSFFEKGALLAWAAPLAWWLAFVFALFATLICINSLLRRQWIEHERLSYPIIQLPLEMTLDGARFFRSPVMWIGFGVASAISVLNLLNSIFPQVPYVPVKRMRIDTLLGLQSIGAVQSAFYPFAVGISFLIPLDLLLSGWVFYWVYKAEIAVGAAFGLNKLPGYPFGDQQGFGAYMALLGFALWTARGHLARAVRSAIRGQSDDTERGEAMSHRAAFVGIALGMAYLGVFSVVAGMSMWVFALFFAMYFALGTMIARMRAELGFLVHDLHNIEPQGLLIDLFGTRRLGPRNLGIFALYNFFNRAYRAHPAPLQLEAFKIAERTRAHPRRFVWLILASTLVGSVVTVVMVGEQYYRHGADTGHYGPWALGFGRDLYGQLERWLAFPTETDALAAAAMVVGFAASAGMMLARSTFLGWPLHPLGYAMANSWGMYNLWCPLFVAWLCKFVILKHSGLKAYRRAIPFFLGMALGDYVLGYSWSLASVAFDRPLYQFWP
ncbi:hypothetical protein FJZ36_12900 [Candidatus Poribacteria bacterium]|nr:hypothetical protein [Candidatus Poribacteria bacterium]